MNVYAKPWRYVGLCGYATCGKDTIAEAIGWKTTSFAAAMKKVIDGAGFRLVCGADAGAVEGAEAAAYRRNGYDEDAEETERVRGETQMLLRVPKRFKFRGFHRLAKRREKVKSPDVR